MPKVGIVRKLVNPGKRRKGKMPEALKRYWAAKRLGNAGSKRSVRKAQKQYEKTGDYDRAKLDYKVKSRMTRRKAWKQGILNKLDKALVNPVGEIVTISMGLNPGRKRTRKKGTNNLMARRKRRTRRNPAIRRVARRRVVRRRVVRRRRNPGVRIYNRSRRRVARRNPSYRRRRSFSRRRRNPSFGGIMSGTPGTILGILGGGALTKFITDMIPAQFRQGLMGYAVTGIVAYFQGKMVGKFLKNPTLGDKMTIGGFTYLGLQLVGQFAPSFGSYIPFGLRGMGQIAPSSFFSPQVPYPNSMTRFVVPGTVSGAIAAIPASKGMGLLPTRMARVGRMG